MNLQERSAQLMAEFSISEQSLIKIAHEFMNEMNIGLSEEKYALNMIPTYVCSLPTGKEKGLYLAVDLGGTNFRVCSVDLQGDGTYKIVQEKSPVPHSYQVGHSDDLFGFLASLIKKFLQKHHSDKYCEEETKNFKHVFKLGFTFSFPVNQTALNSGNLIRWTKGFDCKDAIGQDVCKLLQNSIDKLSLPIHVAALMNDTVGTLLSRSYMTSSEDRTIIGAIFGTGTNGAYVELFKNITKFTESNRPFYEKTLKESKNDPLMIVNTEWGGFDNDLLVLPNTSIDIELDKNTPNPGYQMFEKRISGMFLGELLRIALKELYTTKNLFVHFSNNDNPPIPDSSNLFKPWSFSTKVLSDIENDNSSNLNSIPDILTHALDIQNFVTATEKNGILQMDLSEKQAVKNIAKSIGVRAAKLSGVALGAILAHSFGFSIPLKETDLIPNVDIGIDGSLYMYYPGFEENLRSTMKLLLGEKNESNISIGLAEDGSGVGAALGALISSMQ